MGFLVAGAILSALVGGMTGLAQIDSQERINAQNVSMQEKANAENMAVTRDQLEWQKHLAQNQYQMKAADMAKAGLNPILAAGGSGITSAPVSSNSQAARVQAPDFSSLGRIFEGLGGSVSAGAQVDQMRAQSEALKAQAEMFRAEAAKARGESPIDRQNTATALFDAQTRRMMAEIDLRLKQYDLNSMKPKELADLVADISLKQSQSGLINQQKLKAVEETRLVQADHAYREQATQLAKWDVYEAQFRAAVAKHDADYLATSLLPSTASHTPLWSSEAWINVSYPGMNDAAKRAMLSALSTLDAVNPLNALKGLFGK